MCTCKLGKSGRIWYSIGDIQTTMADNTSESLPKIKEVRAFVKKASGGDQGS